MGGLLAAWSLLLAMCYICKAADISIQVGDLGTANVDTTKALGFMSGLTTDKSIWWHLSSSTVHPEAFLRFLLLGASNARVLPNSSWGQQEEDAINKRGGLLATRDASIAEFSSYQQNKEWGNLNFTAWMLGFHCVSDSESATATNPCTSIAPVAIVNRVDETSNSACLQFTSVWDKLVPGNNVVTNSITANLVNVSKEEIPWREGEWEKLSLKVSKGIEPCPSPAMVAVRSSLDATYNNGPYACHQISPKEYLLVLGIQEFNPSEYQFIVEGRRANTVNDASTVNSSSPDDEERSESTKCIKQWLHNNSETVDLGKCQGSPLLAYLANDHVFVACHNSSSTMCLLLDGNNSEIPCEERMTAFNSTAKSQDFGQRDVSAFNYIMWGSSNHGLPMGNVCETTAGINMSNLVQSGKNIAVDPDTLRLLLTGLSNRYGQAHGDAFQLQKGPSTDSLTAVIALVGAAVSLLTAVVPVTNFLLRLVIKVSGSLHGSNYRYRALVLLSLLNVAVVAFVSYVAVFGVMMSETQREEEFSTWALITETVLVNPMGLQLQTMYVVQGKSVYKSNLLTLIWVLVGIVLPLVGGMTYYRFRDVLKKLALIKQKGSSSIAQVDDYMAIEMGSAEYLKLLHATPDTQRNLQTTTLETQIPDTQITIQTTTPDTPTTPDVRAANLTFKRVVHAVLGMQAIKNARKED